jgi:hypothetical protein
MNIVIKQDATGPSKLTRLHTQIRASILGIDSHDDFCRDLFSVSNLDVFPEVNETELREVNKKRSMPWHLVTSNTELESRGDCKKEDNGLCKVQVYNDIGLKHPYKQIGVMTKFPFTKVYQKANL